MKKIKIKQMIAQEKWRFPVRGFAIVLVAVGLVMPPYGLDEWYGPYLVPAMLILFLLDVIIFHFLRRGNVRARRYWPPIHLFLIHAIILIPVFLTCQFSWGLVIFGIVCIDSWIAVPKNIEGW